MKHSGPRHLLQKRAISTWPIELDGLEGLWISPYPFTSPTEIDALASALLDVERGGLPS
jgi:hypothetical protein